MLWVKDILEIIYYIAFIILTFLIVLYAIKTYKFQTKSESILFCKLYIPTSELRYVEQIVCLEVYNCGNKIAKDITINIEGQRIATVDYIKPNESATLQVGEVLRMMGGNRVFIQSQEVMTDAIIVTLCTDGKELHYNTGISSLVLRSDVLHNESEVVARTLQEINKTLGKAFGCQYIGPGHSSFRDELCEISRSIKNGKN